MRRRPAGVPVMLSRTDTENTVIALEGIFDRTRFHGERKLERMSDLLGATSLSERGGGGAGLVFPPADERGGAADEAA